MKRSFLLVAAVVLVVGACSSDKKATSTGGSSSSSPNGAQSVPVSIDASTKESQTAFFAYFPKELTVHPGDTIDFASHFNGEPHTVTMGTLVDQGFAKLDPNAQSEPPELAKVPQVFPQGPGDAIQAGAQPCYIATGDPPTTDACPRAQQKQPEYDGTQSLYSSGWVPDGEHFKVPLSKGIKPGTYTYFCEVHREGMSGKFTVVAADAKAQTADEVQQAGAKELSDIQAKIKPTVDAVKTGTNPPFVTTADPLQVIEGGGSEDVQEAQPVLMGPDTLSVKVGDTVKWLPLGAHTLTFGSNERLRTFMSKSPDGSVHFNLDSFAPAGGPGPPDAPPSSGPPDPTAPPTNIDGGTYDGTALKSSGLMQSFPGQLLTYSLKFTVSGSYTYVCLIHPDMKGTINVS